MSDLHGLFDDMIDTVMSLPDEPLAGLEYWRGVKEYFSDIPLLDMEWVCPHTEGFDPQDETGEFVVIDGVQQATPLHFTNQIKRIPMINKPNERKIMQMALNIAQAVRKGQLNENEMMFHDVVVNI